MKQPQTVRTKPPRPLEIKGLHPATSRDIYYYLLRAPWWQVIALVSVSFILLNALFAIAFWITGGVKGTRPDSFFDVFFFSVQTMGTIGYGAMYPETVAANLLVTVEAITGLISTAVVTGLAFAKFSRPTAKIMFSDRVLIAIRDAKPTLMVRVANERSTHVAEATMRISVLRWETTAEGERVRKIHDLPLIRGTTPAFMLTWTGLHVIDERSPLHSLTRDEASRLDLQIIVTITGHDETFAATIHARNTYSSAEIEWNKRFADVIQDHDDGRRVVDYTRFHDLLEPAPETPRLKSV